MRTKPTVHVRRKNQRGIALAFFGILMLMFTAFAVVGVDVGRLAFTASEVQSMADAAALAAIGEHAAGTVDPTARTTTLASKNTIDGRAGDISNGTTAGIKTLTPGSYDFKTKAFVARTWADPLTNAAKAVGQGTVTNLVAAAIGVVDSTVNRQAIAAAGGACNEVGAFPIAIELDAIQPLLTPENCKGMTNPLGLFQTPGDNSCYSTLRPTGGNGSSDIIAHIPTTCVAKQGGKTGGGATEQLNIGDQIALNGGQADTILQVMQGCPPNSSFVVPVVGSSLCASSLNGTGSATPIVSFARITIDHVNVKATKTEPKGVFIKNICTEEVSGDDAGCNTAGEKAISLVE